MRHGYTNSTVGDGEVVEKRFAGPDAEARLAREYGLLSELRDQLPVPPVLDSVDGTLRLGFVAGVPGQDLLDAGQAEAVLDACGRVLSRMRGDRLIGVGDQGHCGYFSSGRRSCLQGETQHDQQTPDRNNLTSSMSD